jgi:hypothetical protein
MRATVLAARAINTEDIVRNQLAPADAFDDVADEAEEEEAEEPYLAPAPVRPAAAAASSPLLIGARQSAPPGALAHRLAPPASNGATGALLPHPIGFTHACTWRALSSHPSSLAPNNNNNNNAALTRRATPGFRKQTRTQNSLPPVMNTTMQLQQRQQQTLHSEGEDGPGNADKMRHTTMTGQHINQIQVLTRLSLSHSHTHTHTMSDFYARTSCPRRRRDSVLGVATDTDEQPTTNQPTTNNSC